MSEFRFLKKKDGTKVLQRKDYHTLKYSDVPIVEEEKSSAYTRIQNAILALERRGDTDFIILISREFREELKNDLDLGIGIDRGCSIYGHNIASVNFLESDFKIVKELYSEKV